jgi:hypothetical protein
VFTLSIHDGGIPHITNGNQGAIRATLRAKLNLTQDEITNLISRVEDSRGKELKGRKNGLWWTIRVN